MQVSVYNLAGEVTDNIEVDDRVFGVDFNEAVVHQAVVRQQANARQGTSSTKTRGQVSGSTRKLYRQKGTGNARAGSIKSGLRRGGGIIFGPQPRDYHKAMPKKMRQLALRCSLSAKLRDEEMIVLEQLQMAEPKTREIEGLLAALGIESSVLLVTAGPEENVVKSARNIPGIKTLPANLLNVLDVLTKKRLVMTVDAVRTAEKIWGETVSAGGSNAPV